MRSPRHGRHIPARLRGLVGLLLLLTFALLTAHYLAVRNSAAQIGRVAGKGAITTPIDPAGPMHSYAGWSLSSLSPFHGDVGPQNSSVVAGRDAYIAAFVEGLAASDVPLLKSAALYLLNARVQCNLDAAKREVSWAKDDGRRRDIGICVQIRDDASILDEFIAFHWLQVRTFATAMRLVD